MNIRFVAFREVQPGELYISVAKGGEFQVCGPAKDGKPVGKRVIVERCPVEDLHVKVDSVIAKRLEVA